MSTLGVKVKLHAQYRKGYDLIDLTTKAYVRSYQLGMAGIDMGDQILETGADFYLKSHFTKWYNTYFFAVCDFMVLNSYVAWNISAREHKSKHNILRKCDFYANLAEEITHFTDLDTEVAQNKEVMTLDMYCGTIF